MAALRERRRREKREVSRTLSRGVRGHALPKNFEI